ncbi:CBS domain-containing protein [Flavobacterium sp. SM2513]|uniref:CBS domain-containing protein n=1 Tax=Flavobacterium sp. SM2513 TaxID=3424766 RepID=UPI003D7F9D08
MKETFKVSQFINPNFKNVTTCSITDSIEKGKTLMLLNDFSQIPVLNSENKIIGAISWKSIGKSEVVGTNSENITEYLEEPAIVKETNDFLKYIKLVAKKDYILVVNSTEELVGIITTYDMTIQFKDFLVPFLKLGIIEDCLKYLITKKSLTIKKDINDLTFGEYKKIFDNEDNWNLLNLKNIDRQIFIEKLDQIRLIRNTIAHYKPEGIDSAQKFAVDSFSDILQKVCT